MQVVEIAPGLWWWSVRHPDWTPEQGGPDGWGPDVGSVYCEAEGAVVLVDPLVPQEADDERRFWDALGRDLGRAGAPPDILLTCGWHARSSAVIAERYDGATVRVVEGGIEDLPEGVQATTFSPGEKLPGGGYAIDATIVREVLFWLPSHAALVAGDTLLGDGAGGVRLCPESWLGGRDPTEVRAQLWDGIRGLPVERVLLSHGEPVLSGGREALERALSG